MRIRVTFSKTDHMRYTSHLDLHRTWERTLRRARLPLAYSSGFNPRPKINLAAALPLGFTSECEIVEFWLEDEIPLIKIEKHIHESVPPGIELGSIQEIDSTTPKIPNLVESADYMIVLLDNVPDLDQRVSAILTAECLHRERHGKTYDLRPLIEALLVVKKPDGDSCLHIRLIAQAGATGRPEEVLRALGLDPFSARIHRKALNLKANC